MHIKVRVTAEATKERFEALSGDTFKISVKVPAQENAANRRVVELIARHFGVAVKNVRIIKGHRVPSKLLLVKT